MSLLSGTWEVANGGDAEPPDRRTDSTQSMDALTRYAQGIDNQKEARINHHSAKNRPAPPIPPPQA